MARVASHRVRFTVDEYLRMSEAGILGSRRTELIAGRIIKLAPQLHLHMWAISKITRVLMQAITAQDWLIVEGTFYIDDDSAPEPDFHLFDVPEGTPKDRLPLPMLVIEVSHTTYRRDSGSNLRMYARAGIADYWIVNLPERRVEVYRDPVNATGKRSDWKFASIERRTLGENVSMLKRPGVIIPVSAMLP